LKHYQDEARPKPTKNKRVRWAPSPAHVKEFERYKISNIHQIERDVKKAKKEKRKEQFWKVFPCNMNINENRWRRYCEDRG
jgi:hypothetical protein